MSNMFANLARKATTLSPLMENRAKMSVQQIIEQYPEGITVAEFDLITTTDNGEPVSYPVMTFAEEPDKFAFGGLVMRKIVDSWVAAFDGDIEACSAALKANGGVKLRFAHDTTKDGKRNITTIEVIG